MSWADQSAMDGGNQPKMLGLLTSFHTALFASYVETRHESRARVGIITAIKHSYALLPLGRVYLLLIASAAVAPDCRALFMSIKVIHGLMDPEPHTKVKQSPGSGWHFIGPLAMLY